MTNFEKELEKLLNHYGLESGSNTPDFVLAKYLKHCLTAFDVAVNHREEHFGRGATNVTKSPPPSRLDIPHSSADY